MRARSERQTLRLPGVVLLAFIKKWFARYGPAPVARHVNLAPSFKVTMDDDKHMVITMADARTLLQITLAPEYVAAFVDIGLDALMVNPDVVCSPEQLIDLEPGLHERIH